MIEVQELKSWLGILSSDTSYDQVLQDLEKRTVVLLENETDRYFGPVKTITEYVNGNGRTEIWLKEKPITITSVSYRDYLDNTWTAYATTDYEQHDRVLFRLLNEEWPLGKKNIRVIYTAGYDVGTEPEDIRQAVLDLISMKFRQRGTEGMHSQKLGDYEYTKSDIEKIPFLRSTIARYRRAFIGG